MEVETYPTLRRGGRLCAAVSAVRRATDAAHPLRVLSARCAAGAGCFCLFVQTRRGGRPRAAVSAVKRATDAAHPLRVLSARRAGGAGCLRRHHLFSRKRKDGGEKSAGGTRNSAYAQKNDSFRCAYFRYTFRSPNALRATVESGFRIAR